MKGISRLKDQLSRLLPGFVGNPQHSETELKVPLSEGMGEIHTFAIPVMRFIILLFVF